MASKHENEKLRYLHETATAVGEVVSVTADQLTIEGSFSPGMGTYELRPGARVFVINEDDAMSVVSSVQL